MSPAATITLTAAIRILRMLHFPSVGGTRFDLRTPL